MATELSIENLEEVYNIVGVLPSDGHGALVARLAEIWELFVKNEEQIISEDELITTIKKTITEWTQEEVDDNPERNIDFEARCQEHYESFMQRLLEGAECNE